MFARRFGLSIKSDPDLMLHFIGPHVRPQSWPQNRESDEVPDREMTRKLRKKQ